MNAIWLTIVFAAFVAAALTDRMEAIGQAAFDSARTSVTLAIGLVGAMALWLGLMRVLRDGGLLHQLARAVKPVMVRLFPDVPSDHPAISAMIMNLAANVLGLGNAATPLGIKAMQELDSINPRKGVASDAMVLFLAINTSSLTMVPVTAIAIRDSLGSAQPGAIILPTIFATTCTATTAIILAKWFSRWKLFAPPVAAAVPVDAVAPGAAAAATAVPEEAALPQLPPARPILGGRTTVRRAFTIAVGVALLGAALYWAVTATLTSVDGCRLAQAGHVGSCLAGELGKQISVLVIPGLVVAMLLYGVSRGVTAYQSFVTGAKEGFEVAIRIIPYLVAILVGVGMLRASGALDGLVALLRPVVEPLGMPAEALPMALIRPLSGSGALGVMTETMKAHGPDSLIGHIVSVINGSSETTFYVLAVYFGAVRITRIRHALAAALLADAMGVVASVFICRMIF
ncbi:MAG: spore maturation protein [Deltaproteobacteria bacterium]|nr:spore maturation protein [Deltaproteobacteria bacterium]